MSDRDEGVIIYDSLHEVFRIHGPRKGSGEIVSITFNYKRKEALNFFENLVDLMKRSFDEYKTEEDLHKARGYSTPLDYTSTDFK